MSYKSALIAVVGTATCLVSMAGADVAFHNGTGVPLGSLPAAGDPYWDGAAPANAGVSPFVETHNDWFAGFPPGLFPPAPQSGTHFEKTFQSFQIHRLRYDYAMVFESAPFIPGIDPITGEPIFLDPTVNEPSVGLGLDVLEDIFNDTGIGWAGYEFRLKDADILLACRVGICESDEGTVSIGDIGVDQFGGSLVLASDIGFTSTAGVGLVTVDILQNADGPLVTLTFQNALPYNESFTLDYIVNFLGLPDNPPGPGLEPSGFFLYQEPIPVPVPGAAVLAMIGFGMVGWVRRTRE